MARWRKEVPSDQWRHMVQVGGSQVGGSCDVEGGVVDACRCSDVSVEVVWKQCS